MKCPYCHKEGKIVPHPFEDSSSFFCQTEGCPVYEEAVDPGTIRQAVINKGDLGETSAHSAPKSGCPGGCGCGYLDPAGNQGQSCPNCS